MDMRQGEEMHILIADDSPIVRTALKSYMEMWGFHYDMAEDGAQALTLAQHHPGGYDMAIMDISMPVLNGFDATRKIRQHQPYFPILGYSTVSGNAADCLEAGMDEFRPKPCPPNQLLEIINELTSKLFCLVKRRGRITIEERKPMNSDELAELRALKKQGLTKLKLLGLERSFIVHKNIQNKISYDLIGAGKEISEFIDRSPDEPGRCHLYKANLYITKDLLLPEELEAAMKLEDEQASRFTEKYEVREQPPVDYMGNNENND